jgi:hypothetical protein
MGQILSPESAYMVLMARRGASIMTEQEHALKEAKKQFGTTAFTEHHINYRRVGFRRGGKVISAVGDTWKQAFSELDKKKDL